MNYACILDTSDTPGRTLSSVCIPMQTKHSNRKITHSSSSRVQPPAAIRLLK